MTTEKFDEMKCVVVGDGGIGKTTLIMSYSSPDKKFAEYQPNINMNYSVVEEYKGKKIEIKFWDTQGQDDYDELRPLSYTGTDLFLLCFTLDGQESLEHTKSKWVIELKKHQPKTPIILVGLRSDLRDDVVCETPVSTKDGELMGKELKTEGYFECSSKKMTGMEEIFKRAVSVFYESKGEEDEGCTIL